MRKTNTKTSLTVIMNKNGTATIKQTWCDNAVKEGNCPIQASEQILCELIKIPEYKWLKSFCDDYFCTKYCDNCDNAFDRQKCNNAHNPNGFPYCFTRKEK